MFDAFDWLVMVSAALVGNGLTAWFIHSIWTITKLEKIGGKPSEAPWPALFGVIIPGLVGIAGGLILKTAG